MKTTRYIFAVLLSSMILFSGCEEDPLNLFNDDPRDGITGFWDVNEESSIFKKKDLRTYGVNITKHPTDTTAIYIDGFYELSAKVKVIMNGRQLTIPQQTHSGYIIQNGSGSISFDFETINFSYDVDLGIGEVDEVTAEYNRDE